MIQWLFISLIYTSAKKASKVCQAYIFPQLHRDEARPNSLSKGPSFFGHKESTTVLFKGVFL